MDLFGLFPLDLFNLLFRVLIFPGLGFIMTYVYFVIWLERKLLARVMLRIGPLHVGRYAGILQVMADFIKMLGKEIIIPSKADKKLYMAMPIFAVLVAALPLAVIPLDNSWVIFRSDYSLLYFLGISSLFPVVAVLTGWASNNKYSFIGGLRAAYQLLGYEVPMHFSLVSVAILAGSLDIVRIVREQESIWFIFLAPISFLVYFIAAMAELERSPFDIPEAEQEIVVGWMTEYTGISFGLFYLAQYMRLCVGSLLVTALFFGGGYGPAFIPPFAWFLIKSVAVVTFIILVRGAFPRMRMDQLLNAAWSTLTPIAIFSILATLIVRGFVKPILV